MLILYFTCIFTSSRGEAEDLLIKVLKSYIVSYSVTREFSDNLLKMSQLLLVFGRAKSRNVQNIY